MYVTGAVLIVVVAGIWWIKTNQAPAVPVEIAATSSESSLIAASSTSNLPIRLVTKQKSTPPSPTTSSYSFSLVPGEGIASWDFAGTHKDGGQLEARVRAEIEKMKGLLNSGASNRYELYVSIANQYNLLGDGRQEFTYLNYALGVDSTKTGLAWHNMGKLLERLGAYKSARVAYDAMIQAQPTSQYILARLEFLKAHMPEDTDAIGQVEADLGTSQD